MKKLMTVLCAAIAVAGCATNSAEDTAETSTANASGLATYLRYDTLKQMDAGQLDADAHAACDAMREGASKLDVLDEFMGDRGVTNDEATNFLYASAKTYCPEQVS